MMSCAPVSIFKLNNGFSIDINYAFFVEMLYYAPEHLREEMPPKGSRKGDVYSFGIILEEIILRAGPYDEASITMSPAGTVPITLIYLVI